MNYQDENTRAVLKSGLQQLNRQQLKTFYSILAHYWVTHKFFISRQNFYNLWCELNYLSAQFDESFPEPYDDCELIKSFCQAHPFYFIDILSPDIVIDLFCQYLNKQLDVLSSVVKRLHTGDLRTVYEYINRALELSENIDELVEQTEEYIKAYP
jgi:hypothetical protein